MSFYWKRQGPPLKSLSGTAICEFGLSLALLLRNGGNSTMASVRDKSVLIVDDDAALLRALGKVLRSEGATVTSAEWVGDAIEFLTDRQIRFDLVITDLRMPLVSGMTAVFAIHKIFPKLPVIVLTAFGSPELKAECLKQGAAAFLEKPLDSKQLLAAIEAALAPMKSE
jgi:DNA-binding NtrC family response regulator